MEGLIDTLIPYTSAPDLNSAADAWDDPKSIEFFVDLVHGTNCVLAPNLMPRNVAAADLRRRASALYDAGVEHFFAWDCVFLGGRAQFDDYWDVMRRLGHHDEIETWTRNGAPPIASATTRLTSLSDWDMSYATPG